MQCVSPISIPRPDGGGNADRLTVPCGRCAACMQRKREEWSYRLNQEWKVSKTSFFVTLTYAPETITKNASGVDSVHKEHIQKFLKRLRKNTGQTDIRYYMSSEYGPRTFRPHYHIILFNVFDPDQIIKAWKLGFCRIDPVNEARINYVTKYCITKSRYPENANKVFSLMSRKPGIGANYIETHRQWHDDDPTRMYAVYQGGRKTTLPRYYKDKIYRKETKEAFAELCIKRAFEKRQQAIEDFEKHNVNSNFFDYERQQKEQFINKVEKSIDKSIL